MKQYLPIALAFACTVLVISLVVMKRGDSAQHESDAGQITDFSNQLDSAQLQIAFCNGTMLTLSNSLDEGRSTSLTFSNQLMEAQSAIALYTEQITNLNRRVAGAESENQTLNQRIVDLNTQMTNQIAGLTKQLAATQASFDQVKNDHALLENRFRRDVAERIVVERKFNNPQELQAQLENLQRNPAAVITADSIYAGLDVEVKSNKFYVISPN